MDELEVGARRQLGGGIARDALPRRVHALEVTVEPGDREEVERECEEPRVARPDRTRGRALGTHAKVPILPPVRRRGTSPAPRPPPAARAGTRSAPAAWSTASGRRRR